MARLHGALSIFAVIVLAGCTPAPVEVSGTIKVKGQPPNSNALEISFLAPDGRTASAAINPDGTYTVPEVPVGELKVSFVYLSREALAARKKGGRIMQKGSDSQPLGTSASAENPIPESLREAATSKLTVNIVARQKNTFDYDIKP
jgi:hypothetical protein